MGSGTAYSTDVLVVGAGPIGLTAALELRRRGVACRVVDKLTEPPQYAKAVGVQARTLELWEKAGVLPAMLDAATSMSGQYVYRNGEQVAAAPQPPSSPQSASDEPRCAPPSSSVRNQAEAISS